MSHDVNILVNGSRCKQYNHNGKIFIEAKEGSEYTIEIKNNTWKRILAVCSVDGLDILNGKPATEDGPGYVISGLNSSKFDGFRVDADKVAKFEFSFKSLGDGYAASKGDGSEKNVGVIGIRLFDEKEKPAPIVIREEHHHHHDHYPKTPHWRTPWWDTGNPPYPSYPTIWCESTYSTSISDGNMNDTRTFSSTTDDGLLGQIKSSNIVRSAAKGSSERRITAQSMNMNAMNEAKGFDMATKWGAAKESKVVEVDFERGVLALNTNIYYASRQSLIEMGVPLGNEKQVSFPEPFVDSKYAKPPKGWKA